MYTLIHTYELLKMKIRLYVCSNNEIQRVLTTQEQSKKYTYKTKNHFASHTSVPSKSIPKCF